MTDRPGRFVFECGQGPALMGILNVTPDSFSDGGLHRDPQRALDHALRMQEEGARIIDVGGESTRPGAAEVTEQEELNRVLPVLKALARYPDLVVSIDTRKPAVAMAALDAGARIVNDVEACREDPEMWRVVARHDAAYVAMHMRGTPATMQQAPRYKAVLGEVEAFFGELLERLGEQGVRRDGIALDVGVGFGKTLDHNLRLQAHTDRFLKWGRPLLLGVSRKSFLGVLAGGEPEDRLSAGLAATLWGRSRGVDWFRTHDVAETRKALQVWEALRKAADPVASRNV